MRSVVAQIVRGAAQRRGFATTPRRLDNYAFVGLGQMVSNHSIEMQKLTAFHFCFYNFHEVLLLQLYAIMPR